MEGEVKVPQQVAENKDDWVLRRNVGVEFVKDGDP